MPGLNWCQLINFWCHLINIWGHVLLTTSQGWVLLEGLLPISRYLGSALTKNRCIEWKARFPPVHLRVGDPKGLTLTPNFDCLDFNLSFMKNCQNVDCCNSPSTFQWSRWRRQPWAPSHTQGQVERRPFLFLDVCSGINGASWYLINSIFFLLSCVL